MSAGTIESVDKEVVMKAEIEALTLAITVLTDERDDAYRQGYYEGLQAGREEVLGDGWDDDDA